VLRLNDEFRWRFVNFLVVVGDSPGLRLGGLIDSPIFCESRIELFTPSAATESPAATTLADPWTPGGLASSLMWDESARRGAEGGQSNRKSAVLLTVSVVDAIRWRIHLRRIPRFFQQVAVKEQPDFTVLLVDACRP